MLIKAWMTTDVITVHEDTPITKASIIMKERNIRSLPVLNKEGKLLGIVTDRHLKAALPSKATTLDIYELHHLISRIKVKDLMTVDPVFARPDETVELAAVLMLENKISSLPVIDEEDSLIGIITQTDIFKVLINITGIYSGGMQFALSLEDRPGSIGEATDLIRSHGGRVVSILSTRETAGHGRHNVYIRTRPLPEDKTTDLVRDLEKKFTVIYAARDFLEEVEGRGIRIPH